jgi:hypothetical protein
MNSKFTPNLGRLLVLKYYEPKKFPIFFSHFWEEFKSHPKFGDFQSGGEITH